MDEGSTKDLKVAYSLFIACYSSVLIFICIQLFKFIIRKQGKTTRSAAHVFMLLALVSGVADYTSRLIYVEDTLNVYYGLCYIPSCYPIYFLNMAYALTLYKWVKIYSLPNREPYAWKIAIIIYAVVFFCIANASGIMYCIPSRNDFSGSGAELQIIISDLLYAIMLFVGGLALSLGFIIYGARIIMRLKTSHAIKTYLEKKRDEYVYKVTIQCILLSGTTCLGLLVAVAGYALSLLNIIKIIVVLITTVIFVVINVCILMYISKPNPLKSRLSASLVEVKQYNNMY